MYRLFLAGALIFMAACSNKETLLHDLSGLNLEDGIAKAFVTPMLQSYQSCEQLKNDLKETALREMNTRMAI
ncbi:MAG TPA: hypothetical protein VEK06_04665, partial [Myxococcota bacterium]|nr:hypothetical protein [Myxococcota bacterium]